MHVSAAFGPSRSLSKCNPCRCLLTNDYVSVSCRNRFYDCEAAICSRRWDFWCRVSFSLLVWLPIGRCRCLLAFLCVCLRMCVCVRVDVSCGHTDVRLTSGIAWVSGDFFIGQNLFLWFNEFAFSLYCGFPFSFFSSSAFALSQSLLLVMSPHRWYATSRLVKRPFNRHNMTFI